MRSSAYFLATQKEVPSDAERLSHQLMLRAGLIRPLSACGLYTWLPTGMRVLNKVIGIVREEMERIGALETMMPMVQPASLWKETQRLSLYGKELLRFQDRHQRDCVLGPTHEEVITDLARKLIRHPSQLPLTLFQIQTKFRDERRPRGGVLRAREFLMKDAYSFHLTQEGLDHTYQEMYHAYERLFARCGLTIAAVQADAGNIGGEGSHEFHAISDAGEDLIAFSTHSRYAANVELAEAMPSGKNSNTLKLWLVEGEREFGLLLDASHTINPVKLKRLGLFKDPIRLVEHRAQQKPLNTLTLIADRSVEHARDFTLLGMPGTKLNWEKDLPRPAIYDLRMVETGDPSPDGQGTLQLKRGIEVGHLFKLGCKYSAAMGATIEGAPLIMGCYGIGVSRIVAAIIEQQHHDRGIRWPEAVAPFQVGLVALGPDLEVKKQAEQIYQQLREAKIDVLFDDREERPGVMLADMELIGPPHLLIVGTASLARGSIEHRSHNGNTCIPLQHLHELLTRLQPRC